MAPGDGVRTYLPHVMVLMFHTHTHTPRSVLLAAGLYSQPFTITSACSLERHFSPPPSENEVSVTSHMTYFVYCYIISYVSLYLLRFQLLYLSPGCLYQ